MLSPGHLGEADRLWQTLADHVTTMDLDGATIPILDIAGRCLVLCLHAVASGNQDERVRQDLQRALATAGEGDWQLARDLAHDLGVEELLADGLAVVDPTGTMPTRSIDALLKRSDAVGSAFGLQRLAQERGTIAKVRALWREALPSAAFMRRADPRSAQSRAALARAYVRRLRRLATQLPGATRQWRSARGATRDNSK